MLIFDVEKEVASTATKSTKKELQKKICLACPPEGNQNLHPLGDFYLSKNPMHKDGKVPWCKSCILKYSLLDTGEIDEEKFKGVLQQIGKPYYKDLVNVAINQYKKEHSYIPDEEVKYHGKEIIGIYFTKQNSLRQYQSKSYIDSEKDGFVRKQGIKAADVGISTTIKQTNEDKHYSNIGDFVVTDDIKELFGDGYTTVEYKKMYEKYEKLKLNYTLQTNLHQEALATYVRFKVKEEMATAASNVDEAKKWYDAAQNAASNGKLTPKQLSAADLQKGVNSFSELTLAIEQATDVINILPKYKTQPHDAPDFNIYCYINYARKLKGLPTVEYKDIYKFYDDKMDEYLKQYGDPNGVFTESNETMLKNRPNIEKFIVLPSDYDDLSDEDDLDE